MLVLLPLASAFVPIDLVDEARGPLLDASCNMETVEEANSQQASVASRFAAAERRAPPRPLHSPVPRVTALPCTQLFPCTQLYALLTELSEATFFRLINVNMDGKCPYWGGPEEEEPACESKAEETAVPLCTLGAAEETTNPFGASSFGSSSFGMSQPGMSAAPVDQTITPEEDAAISVVAEAEDCSNEELPTFWLDMCSAIPTNASDYVNLQLNKESYTGYNVRLRAPPNLLGAAGRTKRSGERAPLNPMGCSAGSGRASEPAACLG